MSKQKTVVIVHGWMGSSKKDWMPWLAAELRLLGHKVIIPDMPFRYIPLPLIWIPYLKYKVGIVNRNTYFVAHSVGSQTVMRMLARQKGIAGGAVFVGGWFVAKDFISQLPFESFYKKVAKPFRKLIAWWESPFDYLTLRASLPISTALFSTRDKFVDGTLNAELFFARLGSKIVMVDDAGHFTGADGYEKFPQLLEEIKKLLTD